MGELLQRCEATGYGAASLARLCGFANAINVSATERAVIGGPTAALTVRASVRAYRVVPTTCPEGQQYKVWKGHARLRLPQATSLISGNMGRPTGPLVTVQKRYRSDYESPALTG